jgi:hypothetical protein
MALRWRFFFPAVFLAFQRGLGKHPNIPSGETENVGVTGKRRVGKAKRAHQNTKG